MAAPLRKSPSGPIAADADAPFKGAYYVDPSSTQESPTGSQSNPFRSIAAALSLALIASSAGAVIFLPVKSVISENVTFPNGGDWELTSPGLGRASIVGNIVCSSVAQTLIRLTNIAVTGTLTGVAQSGGGNFIFATGCQVSGAVNLTGSGGGFWWALCTGIGTPFFGFGGSFGSTCHVDGALFGTNYMFAGALSGISQFELKQCRLPASITIAAVNIGGYFSDCVPAPNLVVTGASNTPLTIDGLTEARLIQSGFSQTNCLVKSGNSNASNQRLVTANLGSTSFTGASGLLVNALYEAVYCAELLVAGTLGTALFEIRYTDLNSVAQIEAINPAGLLVTAGIGTKSRGTLQFMPLSGTTPTFSVSGITTPGALSINLRIMYRRVD